MGKAVCSRPARSWKRQLSPTATAYQPNAPQSWNPSRVANDPSRAFSSAYQAWGRRSHEPLRAWPRRSRASPASSPPVTGVAVQVRTRSLAHLPESYASVAPSASAKRPADGRTDTASAQHSRALPSLESRKALTLNRSGRGGHERRAGSDLEEVDERHRVGVEDEAPGHRVELEAHLRG